MRRAVKRMCYYEEVQAEDSNIMPDNAEVKRLLTSVELSWLFSDEPEVTMDSMLYAVGAYADENYPEYYFADVLRSVTDKNGDTRKVLLGKQVMWMQDNKILCAYYPITMTNSQMVSMSDASFVDIG